MGVTRTLLGIPSSGGPSFPPRRRICRWRLGAAAAMTLIVGGGVVAWPAVARADTSASVTITISSKDAGPGAVRVTNNVGGATYGTCTDTRSRGSVSCDVPVPADSGVLLIAVPSPGEQLARWTGPCIGSPGDVCHVQSGPGATTTSVGVKLSPAPAGLPGISLSGPEMGGSGPNGCSPGESVTVSGTGFPAGTTATLSNDGNVVASGMTDSSGNVSLTDGPGAGEPGVYRVVTLDAGGLTASNDVFNSGYFCVTQFRTGGTIAVRVDVSGLDANSSNTSITFPGQSPVPVVGDSAGSGSAMTPYYPCAPGNGYGVVFTGTRGAGTHQAYTFTTTVGVTC